MVSESVGLGSLHFGMEKIEPDMDAVVIAACLDLPARALLGSWGSWVCGSLYCLIWAMGSPAAPISPLEGDVTEYSVSACLLLDCSLRSKPSQGSMRQHQSWVLRAGFVHGPGLGGRDKK